MQFIGLPLEMQNDECRMQNYGVGFADDFNTMVTAKLQFIALLLKGCHSEPVRKLAWESPSNLRIFA